MRYLMVIAVVALTTGLVVMIVPRRAQKVTWPTSPAPMLRAVAVPSSCWALAMLSRTSHSAYG